MLRAQLLLALMDLASDTNLDDKTFLQAKYSLLKSIPKYKAFKPTIKRYLTDHIRGNISVVKIQN